MSVIDIAVSLLRGTHVGALLSLSGTLLFLTIVLADGDDTARTRRALRRLVLISALTGLVTGIAWLIVQTAEIADADSIAMTLHAVPTVALRTQFGRWLLLRLLLLVVLLLSLARGGLIIPMSLSGAALVIQPLLGHPGAIGGGAGTELCITEALHLLAAGAWLGGLLPLFLVVGRLPHAAAAAACRAFTPIGLASVLVLAGTAVVQVAAFMGGLPGLFGTGYGHVALIKLALFVVLLALAALNRQVLTDQLTRSGRRLPMRLSIAMEMALGGLVVVAAGFLASLTPATHEQPIWPFPWRPSLAALEDDALRPELVVATCAAVFGIVLVTLGIIWRRIRWLALGLAVMIEILAIPHLAPLFVVAYPSSFFTSPSEFAATAIAHGERLFRTNCVVCHGVEARGDGPATQTLPVRPADLTAPHFLAHSDGDLYWFISHGFTTPNGLIAMPGFAPVLSTEAVWHLIDYLRAHNAGDAMHRTGTWPQPLPMPQFDALCSNGQAADLDDLRGRALRIVAIADDEGERPPLSDALDATTILVMRHPVRPRAGSACIASEPQVWTALAIITGASEDQLAGTQILVDQHGWLRAVWRAGDTPDETDARTLALHWRDILDHPLDVGPSGAHTHRH